MGKSGGEFLPWIIPEPRKNYAGQDSGVNSCRSVNLMQAKQPLWTYLNQWEFCPYTARVYALG